MSNKKLPAVEALEVVFMASLSNEYPDSCIDILSVMALMGESPEQWQEMKAQSWRETMSKYPFVVASWDSAVKEAEKLGA